MNNLSFKIKTFYEFNHFAVHTKYTGIFIDNSINKVMVFKDECLVKIVSSEIANINDLEMMVLTDNRRI